MDCDRSRPTDRNYWKLMYRIIANEFTCEPYIEIELWLASVPPDRLLVVWFLSCAIYIIYMSLLFWAFPLALSLSLSLVSRYSNLVSDGNGWWCKDCINTIQFDSAKTVCCICWIHMDSFLANTATQQILHCFPLFMWLLLKCCMCLCVSAIFSSRYKIVRDVFDSGTKKQTNIGKNTAHRAYLIQFTAA